MGDDASYQRATKISQHIPTRYIVSSILHRRLTQLGLGVLGFFVWVGISVGAFAVLSGSYVMSHRPQEEVMAVTSYKPHSLFAAVPGLFSIFGYTEGADDPRAAQIERYLLSRNSPMAGAAKTFVEVADSCPMDWALLPAIAGKESSFGRIIPYNSYNAFGWAVYTGQNYGAVFESWEDAIRRVGHGLCENYIKRGRTTPEEIEVWYTPISAQTHGGWRRDVTSMMEAIKSTRVE